MAYTPVPTVSNGQTWTAANQNTYVRDNFAAGVPDIFTTKGDLVVATAADVATRLAAGGDGAVLIPNAASTEGLKWSTVLKIDDAAGELGVNLGGSSPGAPLHVAEGSIATWINPSFDIAVFEAVTNGGITIGSASSSAELGIAFSYNGASAPGRFIYTHALNQFYWVVNGAEKMRLGNGLQMGSPTGGDKGNGTINLAGDIYKNNTAYTNPDYALEQWALGKIVSIDNPGAREYQRLTLQELEAYIRTHHQLPGAAERLGMFDRADFLLEKIEEIYTHLIDLQNQVLALEVPL